MRIIRRMLHKLGLRHSPSVAWEDAGRELIRLTAAGLEQGARETEGMTWEERVRYVLENTSAETLAYAESVAKRSFSTLYEDEEREA